MLVACCSSTYYFALPISLNCLDCKGARLLSPRDSQILPKPACRWRWTMQGLMIPLQETRMSSSGSSAKTLNVTMFPFPMISSGAQLGVIGTIVACWVIFYFGTIVRPWVFGWCNVIYVLDWRGECKPTMYLPFIIYITWVVVKIA